MAGYAMPSPDGQRIPQAENLFKFFLLATLIQVDFLAVDAAARVLPLWAALAAAAAGALANGFFIIGLGVLGHDANHRVLFRAPVMNEVVGGLAAVAVLVPFNANRQFHLTHHSYAHQGDLDPESAMHDRPFWLAATLGSQIGLFLQYRIFLTNLFTNFADRRYTWRVLADLGFLAAGVAFYVALPLALGLDLRWTVVPTLLVFPLVFAWRGLSDHYGVPAVRRRSHRREAVIDTADWNAGEGDRARVTGWVVITHPWLQWLWSSVNFHEVHHKYPWLAHCHLQEAFEQTRAQVPYLVVQGYTRSLLNLRTRPYFEQPAQLREYLTSGLAHEQATAS